MNRWLVLALTGALLGCGAAQTPRMRLQDDLRSFEKKIRWRKWRAAANQVEMELRGPWLTKHQEGGRGLQLTDARIERVEAGPSPLEVAVVYFAIAWYRLPDMTVRERTWRQRWEHGPSGWALTEEVPLDELGEPLPNDTTWP